MQLIVSFPVLVSLIVSLASKLFRIIEGERVTPIIDGAGKDIA